MSNACHVRGPGRRGGQGGPHRFTADTHQRVAHLLSAGTSIRQAAQQVGVSEGTIRHALRRGKWPAVETPPARALEGPHVRSERDARAPGGVAVQRHGERALARMGLPTEAVPQFVPAEAVRYGGALLALPALLTLGVLGAGEQTYGALKKAHYGLRATLLILAFMALLRIRTPEQLQGHPPGELGVLLGLDRADRVSRCRPPGMRVGQNSARPQPMSGWVRFGRCCKTGDSLLNLCLVLSREIQDFERNNSTSFFLDNHSFDSRYRDADLDRIRELLDHPTDSSGGRGRFHNCL